MPDWTREIRRLLAALPEKVEESRHDAAIIQELADHLQDRYEEHIRNGASEREAIDAALAELGDRDRLAATWREAHQPEPAEVVPAGAHSSGSVFADAWRDVRYGARMMLRNPGFTAVAVLTLALGIGANTTVFTVINTVLLNPLPVARASELVTVQTVERKGSREGDRSSAGEDDQLLPIAHLNLLDLRERNQVFSSVAGYSPPFALTLANEHAAPERIFAELVTANFFDTLGLQPVRGRFFLSEEDRTPGTHPVAVMAYATWQQRYGGAPDVVGRTLRINRVPFTIIGIAPEGFKGVNGIFGPDVWVPAMMTEPIVPAQMRNWLRDRDALGFRSAARLKPGVTQPQAEAAVQAIAASLAREFPDANQYRTLVLHPLTRTMTLGSGGRGMLVGSLGLMAVVGLVLLIACSNVANLLLARGAARRQEVAVRLALGAGRARLVRQLLTESVLLGLLSGVVGLGVAITGTRLLWSFRPPEVAKNLIDPAIDYQVLAFGLIVSALTGLVFGAAPAWQSSRANLVDAMKEDTRTAGRTRRRVTMNRLLLVGQVALSMVSLVVAGLCLRAVQRAYAIDPGFDTERVGLMMISPGQAGYDRARSEQFYDDVRTRLRAIPGVTSVAWSTNLPLWARSQQGLVIEGRDARDESSRITTIVNTIDPGYLATLGTPLVRGRDFSGADRSGTLPVALVNETLATGYWPNQDPIGRTFRFAGETTAREIVGIVRTANYQDLGESPQPCVFLPLRQSFSDAMVLYVRTANADAGPVLATVQREIRRIDDQIDLADVRTIQKVISQALFGATMGVGLLGVFGLLGLSLASLGLYGVMAYSVNLRQREIGLRMALGAGQGSVRRLVLREGLTLVVSGIVLGLAVSLFVGSAVSKLLYSVNPFDLASFAGAALVLLTAAAFACYLPARRASRLDPLAALREN